MEWHSSCLSSRVGGSDLDVLIYACRGNKLAIQSIKSVAERKCRNHSFICAQEGHVVCIDFFSKLFHGLSIDAWQAVHGKTFSSV